MRRSAFLTIILVTGWASSAAAQNRAAMDRWVQAELDVWAACIHLRSIEALAASPEAGAGDLADATLAQCSVHEAEYWRVRYRATPNYSHRDMRADRTASVQQWHRSIVSVVLSRRRSAGQQEVAR